MLRYSEDNSPGSSGNDCVTGTSMSTRAYQPVKCRRGLGCSPSKSARELGSHPRKRGAFLSGPGRGLTWALVREDRACRPDSE